MRIAVIADTHNRIPLHLLHEIAAADEIWHLGDVSNEAALESIQALGKPLHVVRGNCDEDDALPWIIDLDREGFAIRLIHIPPLMAPPGCDLLLHGHTHIPRNERVGDTRFFNPGTVGKPNKGVPPSYAWLELVQGRPPRWEIVKL